jgi:hypothetical protein
VLDTHPHKLLAAVALVTFTLWALVTADLAIGGRADPPALRAAAILLDGPWRFHTGDAPQWADAGLDDSAWETVDLTAAPGSHDGDVGLPDYVGGWMARGHPDYHGYAWYRRALAVPAQPETWSVLGPTLVEDGYELYWNGRRLGGSGRLGAEPRLVGTRPLQFDLPADAAGTQGVLAVRVFMRARSTPGGDGGGMHSPPILAPRPIGDALHGVQWQRTIAGYVVDAIEPLAMLALAMLALAIRSRSSRADFMVFAAIALTLTAARRLNNAITAWTDLMDLATYAWLAKVMWIPTLAAWLLAWNRWCLPAWRSIDVAALGSMALGIIGASTSSASLVSASRWASLAVFLVLGTRILRCGPARPLALAAWATLLAALFGGELLDPLGVPGIWFPFGIGVSRTQYVYAIAVPLLAMLMVRTAADRALPDSEPATSRPA